MTPPKSPWKTYLLTSALLPIFIALFVHSIGLFNDFTYDDFMNITDNPVVSGKKPLIDIFQYDFNGKKVGSFVPTFRPLVTLMFALEYRLWGNTPFYFHLVNLLLFCLLLWWIHKTFKLFVTPTQAMLGTLFFAVQGIHVSNVASITNGADTLSLLFLLMAFHSVVHNKLRLASMGYLAAMLSKESSVLMPLLLIIYWFYQDGLNRNTVRKHFVSLCKIGMVGLIFLGMRHWWFPISTSTVEYSENPLLIASFIERLWAPFVYLGKYISLSFIPHDFAVGYAYLSIPYLPVGQQIEGWIGFTFVLLGGIASFYAWKKRKDEGQEWSRKILFGFSAFVASYAIISNTFFLITIQMAERIFLGPSVWLVLLVILLSVKLYEQLPRFRRLLLMAFVGIVIVQSASSVLRTTQWENNLTLFKSLVRVHPKNVKAQYYLAYTLVAHKQYWRAMWHMALAIHGRNQFPMGFKGYLMQGIAPFDPKLAKRPDNWEYPFPAKLLHAPLEKRLHWIPKLVAPAQSKKEALALFRKIATAKLPLEIKPQLDLLIEKLMSEQTK